ncbi:MAG: 50S ribosomal protein L11 [Candidatus Anoxychlamydiales bacterium]|uniref:50S ribosomal protein L11 n=1 Tax=marine sediment metagenome TaxID=412755 RepID=A0A0F9KS19_9ZZZZ|nr:50S ribosomal protein L11 [Candidatus Anoxychlamydiales bacterium]NGX40398.1 50S ribosomal protein L11 [Candidatus Anoxychlamydiales bacterium]HEU63768.1 50S ribosomal protein L11 [Chlamydiota bacterium]
MAKKKIVKIIKLQIAAGKANPGPPIGPALGAAGLNIMSFCKDFNARTQKQAGDVLPVVIEVYQDRTFSFITLQPPVSRLILQELKLEKGSKEPNRDKVGKLTIPIAEKIAKRKMPDMRASSLKAAVQMVVGTAKSMGIDLEG